MAWRNSGPFLFGEIKHPEISGTTVGQSVLMRDASSAVQAARGSWTHGVSGIHFLTDSLSCTWIDRVIHGVTGLPNCFPILRVVSNSITLSTCAAKSNCNSSSLELTHISSHSAGTWVDDDFPCLSCLVGYVTSFPGGSLGDIPFYTEARVVGGRNL